MSVSSERGLSRILSLHKRLVRRYNGRICLVLPTYKCICVFNMRVYMIVYILCAYNIKFRSKLLGMIHTVYM